MVHLTIVLSLRIKAAFFMTELIRKLKAACGWLTANAKTWTQINQTNGGFCANKVEAHSSHINAADKLISRLCCCCNRPFIRCYCGPASLKPFTLPLRTDAIWKADRKQESSESDRACVLPSGTRPLQRASLTQHGKKKRCLLLLVFPVFVCRPHSGPGSGKHTVFSCNILHAKRVIFSEQTNA